MDAGAGTFYEPLKAFYRPKQKKRAFYRSLVSLASPTNGPTPVFSPICTYLRTSLLGGLPTAPPFTLFFVPFEKYWPLYCALLHHCSHCKVFRIFCLSATSFRNFFWKIFLLALEEVHFSWAMLPTTRIFFCLSAFSLLYI